MIRIASHSATSAVWTGASLVRSTTRGIGDRNGVLCPDRIGSLMGRPPRHAPRVRGKGRHEGSGNTCITERRPREGIHSWVQVAWAACYSKRPLWVARGRWADKAKASHRSIFPTIARCAGTRHWSAQRLRQLRTLQLRFARRLANWWPRGSGGYPARQIDREMGTRALEPGTHPIMGRNDCGHMVAMGRPPRTFGVKRRVPPMPHRDSTGCGRNARAPGRVFAFPDVFS